MSGRPIHDPTGPNRHPTARELLRAGMRRAAGRREMAAAMSTRDSEGGATDRRTNCGEAGSEPLVPEAR